jgi:hypothetical protein
MQLADRILGSGKWHSVAGLFPLLDALAAMLQNNGLPQTRAEWINLFVGAWLLFSKGRPQDASFDTDGGIVRSILLPLLLSVGLVVGMSQVGCAKLKPKPQVAESAEAYKKRLSAIYAAQAAEGLRGLSNVTHDLVLGDVLDKNIAANVLTIDNKACRTWLVVAQGLEQGHYDKATLANLQSIVDDIESLEQANVVMFKDDRGRTYFYSLTSGFKSTLSTLQVLLSGQSKHTRQLEAELLVRQRELAQARGIDWTFRVTNTLLITYNRMSLLATLESADKAFAEGRQIVEFTVAANDERILQYRQ